MPLPPGLHAEAPEMFGFFTYEFRVGHYRDPQTKEMVWSTAQGRFGRPLRATGIQHPAPTLTCSVHRDEEKLYVSAPYAVAVMNGKNVTADPPRTELWCLLYAQVRQADNKDSRNILLDDKQLDWRIQIELNQQINWLASYDVKQRATLKNITIRNAKDDVGYVKTQHIFKLVDLEQTNKDATKFGTTAWSKSEIQQLLHLYGLPLNAPLSVLVVEVLPFIRNIAEHVSPIAKSEVAASVERRFGAAMPSSAVVEQKVAALSEVSVAEGPSPVSDELGHHRILRTSPLTEVPFVC